MHEDRRCLSLGARKVEQICNSVFSWDTWNGNTAFLLKQSVLVFKAKFVNLKPAEPRSSWVAHRF